MRGAVIDLGSYTFHATVADADEYGVRRTLLERKTFDRSAAALDELVKKTLGRSPTSIRVIATARDAIADDICARHGLAIEYIDGEEQARLSWLGVSTELACSHGTLAVVDLGGGSLELALGDDDVDFATSLPLGVLGLRGLTAAEVRERVIELAAPSATAIRETRPDTIAITSGTARALVRFGRRSGIISDLQRHVGARTFSELARRLAPLDAAALATLGVPKSRRATIANGAVALATLLDVLGRPVVYVAASAMREGALVDLAKRRRSQPLLLAANS